MVLRPAAGVQAARVQRLTGRHDRPRLLCVYQHAPPPGAPGLYRHRYYFAELVRRGWHVDLVSCPVDYLSGQVPAPYAGRMHVRETIDGIEHYWTWGASNIHRSRVARVLNYATFGATSAARALTLPPPDVVWASSPPLPIAGVGEVVARRFRVPWILEIRDLWPESAASVGWLEPGSALYRLLEVLAHRFASRATSVVVPTPGLERDAYRHGAKLVDVVPGAVRDLRRDSGVRPRVRAGLGVPDEACLFSYIGALGVANGLDVLIDAAGMVRDDRRIVFLLVGDGSDRQRLAERVARERLANVLMIDAVPKANVPDLLAASDVCLHVLRDDQLFRGAQPNKVLEYLAAHRPFITTVDGVPRMLAEASGGGYAASPEALAEEVRAWVALPEAERALRGEQAFRYGKARFDFDANVDQLERILARAIGAAA